MHRLTAFMSAHPNTPLQTTYEGRGFGGGHPVLDQYLGQADKEHHPTDEPRKMAALTRSVRKEGVKEPLTLAFPDEGPQTPMITNGNHRYLAAKRAGLKTVPVKRAER